MSQWIRKNLILAIHRLEHMLKALFDGDNILKDFEFSFEVYSKFWASVKWIHFKTPGSATFIFDISPSGWFVVIFN